MKKNANDFSLKLALNQVSNKLRPLKYFSKNISHRLNLVDDQQLDQQYGTFNLKKNIYIFKSREKARLALVAQRTQRKSTSLAISRTLGFFFFLFSPLGLLYLFSLVLLMRPSRSSCQLTRTRPQQQHEKQKIPRKQKVFFFFENKTRDKRMSIPRPCQTRSYSNFFN